MKRRNNKKNNRSSYRPTPDGKCTVVLNSQKRFGGKPKDKYNSPARAADAARFWAKAKGVKVQRVYLCPHCGGYHISTHANTSTTDSTVAVVYRDGRVEYFV